MSSYFAHPSAVIDKGCSIGEETKIWHFSHIMEECEIGKACNLGQNVVISPQVKIGDRVKIQNNVSVYTGVELADDVFIGPSAVFTNVINPRSAVSRKNQFAKTKVHKGVSIGANATIVCGIEISDYAFIGAGAVVTKDVPAFALLVGNPAKQTGWMSKHGHKLVFDKNNIAVCPEGKDSYSLANNKVKAL